MSHWVDQNEQLLSGLETCDPIYRPTNFWAPGVRQLSAALQAQGLESFKSWPEASTWFYPVYGSGFSNATIKTTFDHARSVSPKAGEAWMAGAERFVGGPTGLRRGPPRVGPGPMALRHQR
jgi:hypothetical protein